MKLLKQKRYFLGLIWLFMGYDGTFMAYVRIVFIRFSSLPIYFFLSQHVKITFIDKPKQEPHYLRPTAWASAKRWSSHADMIGK